MAQDYEACILYVPRTDSRCLHIVSYCRPLWRRKRPRKDEVTLWELLQMVSLRVLSVALSFTSVLGSYTPKQAECPPEPLVRPADGLSDLEEAYRVARKAVADENLKAWLAKTNPGFGTDDLPTVCTTPKRTLRDTELFLACTRHKRRR